MQPSWGNCDSRNALDAALRALKEKGATVKADAFGDEAPDGINPMRFKIVRPGNPDVLFFIATRRGKHHLIRTLYLYKDYERDSKQPKGLRKFGITEMTKLTSDDLK